MQKQKLLKLAKGLRSLTRAQARHFDMSTICDVDDAKKINFDRLPLDAKKLASCNTAACALGWTPTFFPRSNFKLMTGDGYGYAHWMDVEYTDSKGEKYKGFEAGQKMFGITSEEAEYLFDPDCYPIYGDELTPKVVAKRIEDFVKTNGENSKEFFEKQEEESSAF